MGKALTNLGRQVPQPGILYVRQGLVGGEDSEEGLVVHPFVHDKVLCQRLALHGRVPGLRTGAEPETRQALLRPLRAASRVDLFTEAGLLHQGEGDPSLAPVSGHSGHLLCVESLDAVVYTLGNGLHGFLEGLGECIGHLLHEANQPLMPEISAGLGLGLKCC